MIISNMFLNEEMSKICSECPKMHDGHLECDSCTIESKKLPDGNNKLKCLKCEKFYYILHGFDRRCYHCTNTPNLKICSYSYEMRENYSINCRNVNLITCPCTPDLEICQEHFKEHEKKLKHLKYFYDNRRKEICGYFGEDECKSTDLLICECGLQNGRKCVEHMKKHVEGPGHKKIMKIETIIEKEECQWTTDCNSIDEEQCSSTDLIECECGLSSGRRCSKHIEEHKNADDHYEEMVDKLKKENKCSYYTGDCDRGDFCRKDATNCSCSDDITFCPEHIKDHVKYSLGHQVWEKIPTPVYCKTGNEAILEVFKILETKTIDLTLENISDNIMNLLRDRGYQITEDGNGRKALNIH